MTLPLRSHVIDGLRDEVIHHPVGVLPAIAAHDVKGPTIDSRRRHELAEAADLAHRVATDRQQQFRVARGRDTPQCHREAALCRAQSVLHRDIPQQLPSLCPDASDRGHLHGVAVTLHPVDRLAQSAILASFERESVDIDDCLIAHVNRDAAFGAVGLRPLLICCHHGDGPSVVLGKVTELPPHGLWIGADWIWGHQAHAAHEAIRN